MSKLNLNVAATRSQEISASRVIRNRNDCRTFGDLMQLSPSEYLSNCKRCRAYGRIKNWTYSTRASICEPCAIKAKDEVLPGIVTSERTARRWVKNHADSGAKFIAHLSGASLEFVEAEIAKKKAGAK